MSANQPPENVNNPQQVPGSGPQNPQYAPEGQPGYAGAPQVGPDGQPVQPGYGAPQVGPDGQALQPGAYPPPGGFQPQVAEQPKKGFQLKKFLTSLGVAIVVIVLGIMWRTGVFDSPTMKVGDCVQQTGSDSVKVVDCGSADAQFKVLGIKEKQSQSAGRLGACNDWPDTTSIYWEGRNTASGTVYCLQQV